MRFARELPEDSPFAAREVIAGKDARTLARELLAMSQEAFSAAFRKSPMKRAKPRGLKRNAAVMLGNIGNPEDEDVLTRALGDPDPLVRRHAVWALGRTSSPGALEALRPRSVVESDPDVGGELQAAISSLGS